MNKHTYRSKKVNAINWEQLRERWSGQALLFAVDVAKDGQYAELSCQGPDGAVLMHWDLLEGTAALIAELKGFGSPVAVVMESSGTYGDALRHRCRLAGFEVFRASAKRVHDAREVYDGVPSLHDAKAACLIAKLHRDGLTKPWHEPDARERELGALRREYEMHRGQYERCQNRLEAYLSRHWPEALRILSPDSVTLEQVLKKYGSPAEVAARGEEAAADMRRIGGHFLAEGTIREAVASAGATLGEPCVEAERRYLMALAGEMEHSRLHMRQAGRAMEALVGADGELSGMAKAVGLLTTAILLSLHLDPRHFASARAFQKALGLNLREQSSGKHKGRLMLTKRGSALARKYLYYAALRLIKNDPVVARWYAGRLDPKAKLKAVAAVMRKLAMALWHVARGQAFDAGRLLKPAA